MVRYPWTGQFNPVPHNFPLSMWRCVMTLLPGVVIVGWDGNRLRVRVKARSRPA